MQGKRARLRGALLVVLVALVLLPLGMTHQRGVAGAHEQAAAPVLLDVALVNEDVGAVFGGEDLNLGRSFITQVENDADAHWWVVSRSVAEGGLADGRYQLMLVVPADFSAALASLDSAAPERVGITYQVNGDGNARIEALATGKGEDLVARLDQQLVDMYVAAVLDNLRQAQENVRLLVEARDTTTQEYQTDLPPAVAGLSTDLAALAEASQSAADAAVGHVDALDAGAGAASVLAADVVAHGTSLADLVAARDRGALTSAQFIEALMAMDGEVLGEHVQALYDELVRVGDALAEQLAASTPEGSHGDDLARLGGALAQVRSAVEDRQDVLEAQDELRVLDAFRSAVYAVLDTDRSGSVSLAEVAAASSGQGAMIDGDLRRAAEVQIAGLPYRSALDLGTAVAAGDLSHAQGAVGGSAGQIAADLAVLESWDGYADVTEDLGGVARADLAAAIADLQAAEQAFAQQAVVVAAPDPSADPGATDGPGSETIDDGVPDGIEAVDTGVPAADRLAAAAARYGSVVSRITGSYEHAVQLVTLVQQCATSCGAEMDASAAVDEVLVRAVAEQVRTEQIALGDIDDRVGETEAALSDVTGSYQHLVTTSDELSANVELQLAQLAALREALAGVHAGQALVAASEAERSAATDRLAGEGVGLLASSEMLAASSRSAVDRAASGLALVQGLRSDVGEIVTSTTAVGSSVDGVGQTLAAEAEAARVFSASFAAVLPFAHSAGVLNEALVEFIASPVAAAPRAPIVTADVARPFAWVLIAFALCLSAGNLLGSTAQRRAGARTLRSDRAVLLGANARALRTAALCGIGIGLVLAGVTLVGLDVDRATAPVWVLCVVLGCLELTLVVHVLVRQWRTAGAAVCAALMVGYVLVSDAVGAGARSGAETVVTWLDPLCHFESAMVAVLGSAPLPPALWPVLIGIVVAGLAGLAARPGLRSRDGVHPRTAGQAA